MKREVTSVASLKYWLWLTSRTGLGPRGGRRLVEQLGSPEAVYFAGPGEYGRVPDLSSWTRESLQRKSLEESDRILGDCDRLGIRVMTCQDADYPERLRNIYDPPLVLYCKGKEIAFDEEVAIAMVGTRTCTPYGVRVAGKLAMDLARAGAVLVSGIAEGIDAASIRGALKGGGRVVSVLGGGIDKRYPASSAPLYDDVAAAGCLISEYPPGTQTNGKHFPVRNRIISGLSLGVVVVESAVKGGALLTAEHALDQDRDIFAVPGPVDAPTSGGTNRLIRLGTAKLTEKAWDILEEYVDRYPGKLGNVCPLSREAEAQRLESVDRPGRAPKPETSDGKRQDPTEKPVDKSAPVEYIVWQEHSGELTDDQRDVLLTLDGGKLSADELIERTQIPARRVLSALTLLQVQGYVAETPEKRFQGKVKLKME